MNITITEILAQLERCLRDPTKGKFHSTHEGLGVIVEEYSELIEAIQSNNLKRVKSESIDLAVAAIALAVDCDDWIEASFKPAYPDGPSEEVKNAAECGDEIAERLIDQMANTVICQQCGGSGQIPSEIFKDVIGPGSMTMCPGCYGSGEMSREAARKYVK